MPALSLQRRDRVAEIRDRHDVDLRRLVRRRATPDATLVRSACAQAWGELVDADRVDLGPPLWSALAWVTTRAMQRAYELADEQARASAEPTATLPKF